jgi:hypothetical protein
MFKQYASIFLMLGAGLIAVASGTRGKEERQIPVVVTADVNLKNVKGGEVIPLTITVSNGLPSSIYHSTFSLTPNEWNGETCNVSLVDIYRDDKPGNLYLSRPKMNVPVTVSGIGRKEVKPGGKLVVRTDARKWKLMDGWLPGKYRVTVRVDNLTIDKYSTLSVLTDFVEFEIR